MPGPKKCQKLTKSHLQPAAGAAPVLWNPHPAYHRAALPRGTGVQFQAIFGWPEGENRKAMNNAKDELDAQCNFSSLDLQRFLLPKADPHDFEGGLALGSSPARAGIQGVAAAHLISA